MISQHDLGSGVTQMRRNKGAQSCEPHLRQDKQTKDQGTTKRGKSVNHRLQTLDCGLPPSFLAPPPVW